MMNETKHDIIKSDIIKMDKDEAIIILARIARYYANEKHWNWNGEHCGIISRSDVLFKSTSTNSYGGKRARYIMENEELLELIEEVEKLNPDLIR